jgi:hypothetical protein
LAIPPAVRRVDSVRRLVIFRWGKYLIGKITSAEHCGPPCRVGSRTRRQWRAESSVMIIECDPQVSRFNGSGSMPGSSTETLRSG